MCLLMVLAAWQWEAPVRQLRVSVCIACSDAFLLALADARSLTLSLRSDRRWWRVIHLCLDPLVLVKIKCVCAEVGRARVKIKRGRAEVCPAVVKINSGHAEARPLLTFTSARAHLGTSTFNRYHSPGHLNTSKPPNTDAAHKSKNKNTKGFQGPRALVEIHVDVLRWPG